MAFKMDSLAFYETLVTHERSYIQVSLRQENSEQSLVGLPKGGVKVECLVAVLLCFFEVFQLDVGGCSVSENGLTWLDVYENY